MQQVLRLKYGSTTFGHRKFAKKILYFSFSFKLFFIKDKCQAESFCFLLILSLGLFLTSISWSKDRWRSIPSWAKTHMMTHTKRERSARTRNPSLCRKKPFRNYQKLLHQYTKSTHSAELPWLLNQFSNFDTVQDITFLKKYQYSLFYDWKHNFYPFGRDGTGRW